MNKEFAKTVAVLLVLANGDVAQSRISFAQEAKTNCIRGSQECPVSIRLRADGPPIVVRERLLAQRSSFSYQFSAEAGQTLGWRYRGPAVHVVLTDPTGDTEGPGLPRRVLLEKKGRYVFSISSNKMAEGIYGKFQIAFQLTAPK